MNEHIRKFYPGQTVEINLVKEPIKYQKVKIDGIEKHIPITEAVECTVYSVRDDKFDFVRKDSPSRIFRNYSPTAKDKVIKDVPRPEGAKPDELPVIKRLKNGENVVLLLPKEPVKWTKDKDGKSCPETEEVACTVHSVNVAAGTISFVKEGDKDRRVFNNFKVTEENLLQDEPDDEPKDKPLDKMNKDELVAKAEELGIDLTIEDDKVKETKAEIIEMIEAIS